MVATSGLLESEFGPHLYICILNYLQLIDGDILYTLDITWIPEAFQLTPVPPRKLFL